MPDQRRCYVINLYHIHWENLMLGLAYKCCPGNITTNLKVHLSSEALKNHFLLNIRMVQKSPKTHANCCFLSIAPLWVHGPLMIDEHAQTNCTKPEIGQKLTKISCELNSITYYWCIMDGRRRLHKFRCFSNFWGIFSKNLISQAGTHNLLNN